MKLIKKMLSVFLCLTVIIGSLSVGLFSVSAATVKGNRGADGKGFIYKKTAEYTYTDANGAGRLVKNCHFLGDKKSYLLKRMENVFRT